MEFEWDDKKAEANYQKHAVRFSEAATVWLDENALEIPDPEHSNHEECSVPPIRHQFRVPHSHLSDTTWAGVIPT